jgi:MFS family permease
VLNPLRKVHYAWIVAAVTFGTLMMAGGIRSSAGIFVVPVETEFHWSRALISFAVGVNLFVYGLIGPFAAALMERFGVRRTVLTALAMIATGAGATPLMREPWHLVLLWGFVVGGGTGVTANVFAVTIATRWFTARRGFVVGLLTSGAAAGQLLFLPALAALAATFGWRWVALSQAAIALTLLPLVGLLMRDKPEDIGLTPYGGGAPQAATRAAGNPVREALASLAAGLRSRDFWLIGGSYLICGATTNGLIGTHLIPACIDNGVSEVTGGLLLGAMAIFNFVGSTGSGWLSDRFDSRVLLGVYFSLRGLSLLYLPFAFDSFYGLSTFAAFYGLDWLATVPPTIRLTADAFGKEKTGMMFGWMSAIHQLGGALAAYAAGALRLDLGSYLQAFMLAGALCFVSAAMVMFIGAGGRKLSLSLPRTSAQPARS